MSVQPLSAKEINRILGIGYPVREGFATLACPGCQAELSTADAVDSVEIPNGLRFVGVPCAPCGTFYTVEILEA